MLEAGPTKGRDLRLEVRRIRSGASRDRPWDVVWLDFMVPHCHLVVDVTVTSGKGRKRTSGRLRTLSEYLLNLVFSTWLIAAWGDGELETPNKPKTTALRENFEPRIPL
jgi:hypothetical protein